MDVESEAKSYFEVAGIKGRPSDIVRLNDGTIFFGALIGDCVKQVDGVLSNQIFVYADGVRLNVTASRPLATEDIAIIRNRLEIVVPGLKKSKISIQCVPSLIMSVGGKIPLVIYRERETL